MDVASPDAADLAMFRDSVAEVLASQSDSLAVHAFVDGGIDLAAQLRSQASALGWFTIGLPEALGGFGFGAAGSRLLHVELGRAVAPGGYIATLAAADVLAVHGQDSTTQDLLPRIAAGEIGMAVAALPAAPSTLVHDGDGLSGKLKLLGDGDAAYALVPCPSGELALVSLSGVLLERIDTWDATRSLLEASLDWVEPIAIFGQDGEAVRTLIRSASIAVASDSIGLAHGIIAKTIAYLKEREQFGRPIGSFQALKHRMVDMVARNGIAEHLLDQAVDAAVAEDASADMWAMLAKVSATDAAVFVAGDCLQLFGGVGFTWEYDAHLYLKRARLNQMLIGDNRVLADAAADQLAQETRAGRSVLELVTS